MRSATIIAVIIALGSFTQADALGQCQRSGGGRNSQQAPGPIQTKGLLQAGVNPLLAMQQAAMQQALMQQRFAAQQMRMQQIALHEQARREQLDRRRSKAQQRRDAEVARREEVRASNLAKLKAVDWQEALVALKRQ